MKYLRYFLYLAFNWNLRIAWYIIKTEIKGEKKYGIDTTGADELKQLEKKGVDIDHSTIYMPANYKMLEELFTATDLKDCKHFLDIGSGKGRALCVAAHYGATKVTGIDFSRELSLAAKKNLDSTQKKFTALQYNIVNNDAFYYEIPADVDIIFLFNPFDEVIMSGVAENIEISYEKNPRPITIIYANPICKDLFLEMGFKESFHVQKMKYLEAIILKRL
ncbi:MAG: class I SAM-dependent methyltransferase [Ferruginibacter sp.]